FLHYSRAPRVLHSFPTRRSSDLVDRHEILRTRYVPGPRQVVDPHAVVTMTEDDLRGLPSDEAERAVKALSREESAHAFDLARERSEEHTSELQSLAYLVCRLLLE